MTQIEIVLDRTENGLLTAALRHTLVLYWGEARACREITRNAKTLEALFERKAAEAADFFRRLDFLGNGDITVSLTENELRMIYDSLTASLLRSLGLIGRFRMALVLDDDASSREYNVAVTVREQMSCDRIAGLLERVRAGLG